jgi:hypothetical protein
VKVSRIKPAWVITGIAVLGAVFYIGERLYITPTEAVDNTLERALRSLTNEDLDQFNELLHDSLFDAPPPKQVRRFLPPASRSRNEWTRDQFKSSLAAVFERISIQRYVIMQHDITIQNDTATVQVRVLLFYQEKPDGKSEQEDLLSNKFLSNWTLGFIRENGSWNISELTYGT